MKTTIALSLIAAALLCWAALYTAQAIARAQVQRIEQIETQTHEPKY